MPVLGCPFVLLLFTCPFVLSGAFSSPVTVPTDLLPARAAPRSPCLLSVFLCSGIECCFPCHCTSFSVFSTVTVPGIFFSFLSSVPTLMRAFVLRLGNLPTLWWFYPVPPTCIRFSSRFAHLFLSLCPFLPNYFVGVSSHHSPGMQLSRPCIHLTSVRHVLLSWQCAHLGVFIYTVYISIDHPLPTPILLPPTVSPPISSSIAHERLLILQ